MDTEAEPDSNWKVAAETVQSNSALSSAENGKNNTSDELDDDKEEGEISDDGISEENEPVTSSSTTTEHKEGKMGDGEADKETHVSSTNGGESSDKTSIIDVGKSPIKAYTLIETVEKLKKTISFVMFEKKRRESGSGHSSGEDTEKVSRRNENGESDKKTSETHQKPNESEDEDDEVDDDDDENDSGEEDEQVEESQDDESGNLTTKSSAEDQSIVDVTKDTDDDDSLRTLDPSSLSKCVMHLVDSVISENLSKENSSSGTEKTQTKVKISPKVQIIKSVPSSLPSVKSASPVSSPVNPVLLTPKELDDQSTVLSYIHNLKLFKCDARTCGIKTNKEEVIKAHIEQHTGSRNVWYKCIYCKTITKSIENIRKHLQKFHVTDVLRFSKLNSPSVQDVYLSLIGTKIDSNSKPADVDEQSVVADEESSADEGKVPPTQDAPKPVATPTSTPTRRNSTESIAKPAPILWRNSSDAAKANYTTKLECYYKDQYYRCKMCGFKSQNADTFASHAYYHLHGSDGKKGLANCGAANKPHDVADCTVVKGMMGLLQRQKESANAASKTTLPSLPSTTLLSRAATSFGLLPIQPKATSSPTPKQRIILIPAGQGQNSTVTHTKSTTTAPSPIVIEPKEATSVFPPYKSPTTTVTKTLVSQTETSENNPSPIVIEPVDNGEKTTVNNTAAESKQITADKTDNVAVQPSLIPTSKNKPQSVVSQEFESSVFTVSPDDYKVAVEDSEIIESSSKARALLKIKYKDGRFVCLTCNYLCPAVRPVTFRKHIWKDIHPKSDCSHCDSNVMYNKFRNCPVMNKLMGLLEDAVEEAAKELASQEEEEDEPAPDMIIDLDTYSSNKGESENQGNEDAGEKDKELKNTDSNEEDLLDETDKVENANDETEKEVTFYSFSFLYDFFQKLGRGRQLI